RLLKRPPHLAAIDINDHAQAPFPHQTCNNIRKLLDTHALLGEPLPPSMARALLSAPRHQSVEEWIDHLSGRPIEAEQGQVLADELTGILKPQDESLPDSLTYDRTARRDFEVRYWKTSASLSEGKSLTKNNADCVLDKETQKLLPHSHRDLDALGDHLLSYYRNVVGEAGMTGKALVGDLPFVWKTDFSYDWMG